MTDASKAGSDWQDDELDAIVADYFAMLTAEQAGEAYNKSAHRRALMAVIGRLPGSIESKHMNLTAVLSELGLPTIRGYKAATNYQRAIFPAIDRYLTAHPGAWTLGEDRLLPIAARWGGGPSVASAKDGGGALTPSPSPGLAEPPVPFAQSPILFTDPPPIGEAHARPEGLQRLVRKFDPAARDARNRALGEVGEEHVFHDQIARLIGADRMDLAKRVEWTSKLHGDGAGYDIRSFDPASGHERFIEVKTTKGGPRTDFFLSRNERAFSDEEPDRFRLYRLYDAASEMKLFALRPPLEDAVRLSPETWRAGF